MRAELRHEEHSTAVDVARAPAAWAERVEDSPHGEIHASCPAWLRERFIAIVGDLERGIAREMEASVDRRFVGGRATPRALEPAKLREVSCAERRLRLA